MKVFHLQMKMKIFHFQVKICLIIETDLICKVLIFIKNFLRQDTEILLILADILEN